MTVQINPEATRRLKAVVEKHSYPLIFATISGAHLYGFPSPDSDYDLRGTHVLPAHEVVGLDVGEETVETAEKDDDFELDLVTHDIKKFIGLMLRKNGYVLEQLLSPLVVQTSPEHDELKALAGGCVTRYHSHYYLGFAATQWKLFEKETPRRVKPLLYVYRVLMTGIHLMRTGEVEANLVTLNAEAKLDHVTDLVARKLAGPEKSVLHDDELEFHRREYERLVMELEAAQEKSALPEEPTTRRPLNDFLVRVRLGKRVEVIESRAR